MTLEQIKLKFNRLKLVSYFLVIPLSVCFSLFCISYSIRTAYKWDVVIYIERSIDIIAPVVSDDQLKKIKAEYRMIDNYESFKVFNNEIKAIANGNNIKLPKISIIKFD